MSISDVSDSHSVWVQFGERGAAAAALSSSAGVGWRRDPRLPILGGRAIVEHSAPPPAAGANVWRAYRRWRVLHGVAEGDSEIPSGGQAGGTSTRRAFKSTPDA